MPGGAWRGRPSDALALSVRPSQLRERLTKIAGLGLPIVGGMISQNVFNLVDTAMVGSLGDAALAAVGTASFLNFFAISLMMGLSTGVQAMAARRLGEGRTTESAVPLNGALLLGLGVALPITALVHFAAPRLFSLINDTPEVVAQAVPYLQVRVLAVAAAASNLAFRGHWNGVGLSRLYLRTLLLMHASNIALNYALIYGELGFPQLGVRGAGMGSAIATYIGTAYYLLLGFRHARVQGFLKGLPGLDTMRSMLRLAIPGGVQQLFFSGGLTTLFWILGQVGTAETAAANVLVNVMLVAILPAMALGMAAATLVGQSLGRGAPDDAAAWAWDVMGAAAVLLALLAVPMILRPEWILCVFIKNPDTLRIARVPLQIWGAVITLDGAGTVLLFALSGAGAVRTVLAVTAGCQWFLFLPAAYLAGPVLGHGLSGIWLMQALYRAFQAAIFTHLWRRGDWKAIRV